MIYSSRYDCGKTITMLSLYYHELMRKIKKHEGNVLYEVLDGKEIIGIEEFDHTKMINCQTALL